MKLLKYIGRHDRFTDNVYGTGLTWENGTTVNSVVDEIATRMIADGQFEVSEKMVVSSEVFSLETNASGEVISAGTVFLSGATIISGTTLTSGSTIALGELGSGMTLLAGCLLAQDAFTANMTASVGVIYKDGTGEDVDLVLSATALDALGRTYSDSTEEPLTLTGDAYLTATIAGADADAAGALSVALTVGTGVTT